MNNMKNKNKTKPNLQGPFDVIITHHTHLVVMLQCQLRNNKNNNNINNNMKDKKQ